MLTIIQNDPDVPAGTFARELRERGVPFRTLLPYAGEALPSASHVKAAIVLGGAMGVHDRAAHPFLGGVKEFIADCVRTETPFLGICLGGQLLADSLGAIVHSGCRGEKGSLRVELTPEGRVDPLFAGFGGEFATFQWHSDSFDIPDGGIRLASSPACPNQAFRFGTNAYGTQFHPEVDLEIVESWVRWSDETSSQLEEFRGAFSRTLDAYRLATRLLLANFLRIARVPR